MLHIFLACSCIMSSELYYDVLCTYLHGWIWLFKLKLHIELFHPRCSTRLQKKFANPKCNNNLLCDTLFNTVSDMCGNLCHCYLIYYHMEIYQCIIILSTRRAEEVISGVNLFIPWSLSDMQLNEAWYQQCLHKIQHSMTATHTNYFRHIRDRFCSLYSMHVHLHVKGRHTHF